jgi:2-polyprenyl-6-methoxyphenol hydroxylase-like FAD-dependent oxidoreductase
LAPEKDATVLIVGGGVAGLTAGIALDRYGIDSLVFEQVADVRKSQVGAGLVLGYNVARAFKHLDLLDELREVAAPLTRFRFMTYKGHHLGTTRVSEGGELAQGVLRPVFHKLLVDALGDEKIRTGSKFVRFEQDSGGVTAHFADGRKAHGDVLVGADGLISTVRAQLLGESELRYAGYVARRGVVESEAAKEGMERMVLGRGKRFLHYPVGRRHVYWTAVTTEPPGGKESGAEIRRTVREHFQGWPDPIDEFVEATDESNMFLADTYDRDPVERWGEGRVTLLGDSAHPMTWDRGQGASQGIEGAVLLARALAQGDDPAASLRAWEAERIPRTAKYVLNSRKVGQLQQTDKPLRRFLRDQVISRGMASRFGMKRGSRDLLVDYGAPPAAARDADQPSVV